MNTNALDALETLIAICKDGEEGFRLVANEAKSAHLKNLFTEYSSQRQRFATELQNEAITLGEQSPRNHSSVAGAAHRAWMKVRDAVSTRDDHQFLAECERGEDTAVELYRSALQSEALAPSTVDLLSRQYSEICACHARIRELRDGAASLA
jgi:uncharacterized protein (TIGR02284 family)